MNLSTISRAFVRKVLTYILSDIAMLLEYNNIISHRQYL